MKGGSTYGVGPTGTSFDRTALLYTCCCCDAEDDPDEAFDAVRDALRDAALRDAALRDAALRDAALRDAALRDAVLPSLGSGLSSDVCLVFLIFGRRPLCLPVPLLPLLAFELALRFPSCGVNCSRYSITSLLYLRAIGNAETWECARRRALSLVLIPERDRSDDNDDDDDDRLLP